MHSLSHFSNVGIAISIIVAPLSISALMVLVVMPTFIAGRCGDVGQSQEGTAPLLPAPSPIGTDHYEKVDEGGKRAALGEGVYKVVDKQTH